MILRPATKADADFLLGLRNDPSTLERCASTGMVSPRSHAMWLAEKVDQHRYDMASGIYVAEIDRPVGSGRIERAGMDMTIAVLSYTIASDERGNGLGTELVRLLVAEAKRLGYRQVVCKIKRDNPHSVTAAMLGGVDSVMFV